MASLNVNALRSHKDEVKLLRSDLRIDILALHETKLDRSINQHIIEIAGHSQQHPDRYCFGGGVSIYVRESIKFVSRNDIPNKNLELLCIEV